MAYCKQKITSRAIQYYRSAASVQKYKTGHDYLKTLWCYSTKLHPLDPHYRELDKNYFKTTENTLTSSQILEKNIERIVPQMIDECFDEYIMDNPKMQKMNTLRVHPAIAEYTIATPMSFDDELFHGIKAYCDDLGIKIKKTDDSIETLDSKGIPLYMWTSDDSANTGIINCRSRDTGYSYQAHILKMKKLLYTFASDYGPFQPFANKDAWEDFKEEVKAMPALIPENEAFGTPVYKNAWNWNEEEKERIKKVQSTTSLADVIKKDAELEEIEVEEVQQKPGLGVDQFY